MPLTLSELRQWNTRHKNPQLVTQNCFVASFDRCFPFFTLRDQLDPQQKTFVAGWRNAVRWLVDSLEHEQSCCTTSCEFDEKRATKPEFVTQSRPALYFLQQLSSTCNKCFFLRDKLITQGEKRETSMKTCNKAMLHDKLRVFVSHISPPLQRIES